GWSSPHQNRRLTALLTVRDGAPLRRGREAVPCCDRALIEAAARLRHTHISLFGRDLRGNFAPVASMAFPAAESEESPVSRQRRTPEESQRPISFPSKAA